MSSSPALLLARKVYDEALALIADEQGVHAETACALLGVMMGVALFRKHHLEPTGPGRAGEQAFSEVVDDDAPNILAALDALARRGGIEFDVRGMLAELPEQHAPLRPPVELLKAHGGRLWGILAAAPGSPEDRLLASLYAALLIVQQTRGVLAPAVQSALVMRGFVVGAKSLPPDAP